jgi:hypothetical protein
MVTWSDAQREQALGRFGDRAIELCVRESHTGTGEYEGVACAMLMSGAGQNLANRELVHPGSSLVHGRSLHNVVIKQSHFTTLYRGLSPPPERRFCLRNC